MKKSFIHFYCFAILITAFPHIKATTFPSSFQATYAVSRGGKVMAEQTTTIKLSLPNQYILTDITRGTRGLASLTGFKRSETTRFELKDNQIIGIEHDMQQKVAFKNKTYNFQLQAGDTTITGTNKQAFTIETGVKPISSHMLPFWLSTQVCQKLTSVTNHIDVPVLKSKQIKTYKFKVIDESYKLYRVERIYPPETQRSSQIWLDKKQNCLPVKTRHKEAKKPIIETNLLSHNPI